MKKVISIILTTIFFITLVPSSVRANENSLMEQSKYLKSIGASEEYMMTLTDNDIARLYNQFKGKNVKFVGYKEEVVEMADTQYGKQDVVRGNISTSKLKLEIAVYEDVDKNSRINGLVVDTGFKWLSEPIVQSTDALTFNYDGNLFNLSGFYSGSGGVTYSDGSWYQIDYVDAPATACAGGVGWYLNINHSFVAFKEPTLGSGSFYLIPKKTMYTWDNPNTNMFFTYAHQLVGANISFGISTAGPSIGIGISSGSYDEQTAYYTYN